MPDLKQFKLPDVGEGLTEADIIKWTVQPGDTVVVNQMIIEIETAKAVVELPSPYAGVVTALHVSEGETVDVGRPIITIDIDPDGAPAVSTQPSASTASAAVDQAALIEPTGVTAASQGRQPMLVGYGPRVEGGSHRRARTHGASGGVNGSFAVPPDGVDGEAVEDAAQEQRAVLAKPPVRKLAKNLGVDLAGVRATGPDGTITRADVESAVGDAGPVTQAATHRPSGVARPSGETRIPIKGVRKHTAAAMVESAFTAPHVTEFMTIDISETMALRDRIAARREFRDSKVSPLLFVARAVILAALRTPAINSSWDEAAGEIVVKHYVNLGIAAATERGLIVPNIKDADQLSLLELAQALGALTDTARAGRTSPADMAGGTITITNVGVFGVDTGTPILNPGEAGIVAFGAVRRMPWVVAGPDGSEQLAPRWVTQLAVSFDHRLVDGQQGSQFLADVGGILADPGLAML